MQRVGILIGFDFWNLLFFLLRRSTTEKPFLKPSEPFCFHLSLLLALNQTLDLLLFLSHLLLLLLLIEVANVRLGIILLPISFGFGILDGLDFVFEVFERGQVVAHNLSRFELQMLACMPDLDKIRINYINCSIVESMKQKKALVADEDFDLDYFDPADAGRDDHEYQQLLGGQMPIKRKPNDYFINSHKYSGHRKDSKHQEEQEQEEQYEQDDMLDEQSQPSNELKNVLAQIKDTRKQKSKLLEEDLKLIDEEDKEQFAQMRKNADDSGDPQALKNQIGLFTKFAEARYLSQKNLTELKKYPKSHYPQSAALADSLKQCQNTLVSEISLLVQVHEKLARKIFYSEEEQESKIDLGQPATNDKSTYEQLWEKYTEQSKGITEKLNSQIISWSQRTTLLKNSSQNKSHISSLLMQTPIGQAEKVVKDWDRVSKKYQQKRAPIRPLFQNETAIRETHDSRIFDDLDMLLEVQKIYEQEVEKGDKQFLISDTMKYLERKSERTKKDVDRKASKNRKVRFNVHAKLLNFMPCQSENLLEARDEIVNNLFSRGSLNAGEGAEYIDM